MMKFKLTDEFITQNGKKLFRIVALKNFSNVSSGDLGGFIENEGNLSQRGNAKVFGDE